MMGSIGQTGGDMMRRGMDTDKPMGPGKKMDAVGQQAKAAVSAAREAGIELPKNAQGMAASGLARGADPETLFASLVTPEEPTIPDDPTVPDTPVVPDDPTMPVDPVVPDDPALPDDMMAAQKALNVPVQDAPVQMTSAEVAAAMLLAATEDP